MIFNGGKIQKDEGQDKSGNIKYIKMFIGNPSNQGSMDMQSFNFNPDIVKNPKAMKISPNASFQSHLPIFSKDNSNVMFLNNKSGSMDGKIGGYFGAPGSFNLNNKFPPDNQNKE